MEERNDGEKVLVGEEVMLPGFRFHPTDEELVGFYLKRKIQQRPLLIELIKQIDIYKYDPWDLPKLGGSGEKEWYFYCPRDRKYRNSARPNRVTGAGFWKATGTDRPIYSSSSDHNNGNKCIGLKKSLVFYKGRAAKGVKTDWMMHEFRLPSLNHHPPPTSKRSSSFIDHKTTIPPNDSWAICRIFKKTNSTAAQRALSLSSNNINIPPLLISAETNTQADINNNNNFPSSSFETLNQYSSLFNPQITNKLSHHHLLPILAEPQQQEEERCTVDLSSILLNMSSSVLGDFGCSKTTTADHNYFMNNNNYIPQTTLLSSHDHHQAAAAAADQFGAIRSSISSSASSSVNINGFHPFHIITDHHHHLAAGNNNSTFVWDHSSSSCPSEVSTTLSTTNCYT